jgi:predicted metal-binding membrane protein
MKPLASAEVEAGRWVQSHWPWLLIAAAWATALVAQISGQDYVLNHHELIEGGRFPLLLAALVFLLAWQLMTVAMMLPSSLPVLRFFRQANAANRGGAAATATFLAGYAAVWTLFAAAAFAGDIQIHRLVASWPWLAAHSWLIAGGTLLMGGAFQFTPLKERCLAQCRSPLAFFVRHYRRGVEGAWMLGVQHGKFCLGCCWALMLVMFGLGVGNVIWMAGLAGVMLLEKTALRGRQLVPVVGVVLMGWGALVLVHPAWLPTVLNGAA